MRPEFFMYCETFHGPKQIAWARKTSETHPTFWACTSCLVKKKEPIDIQVFTQMGNTMDTLQ